MLVGVQGAGENAADGENGGRYQQDAHDLGRELLQIDREVRADPPGRGDEQRCKDRQQGARGENEQEDGVDHLAKETIGGIGRGGLQQLGVDRDECERQRAAGQHGEEQLGDAVGRRVGVEYPGGPEADGDHPLADQAEEDRARKPEHDDQRRGGHASGELICLRRAGVHLVLHSAPRGSLPGGRVAGAPGSNPDATSAPFAGLQSRRRRHRALPSPGRASRSSLRRLARSCSRE